MVISMVMTGTSIEDTFEEEASRAEHIMGLEGNMEFSPTPGKVFSRKASGNYATIALGYLNEKLDAYIPTLSAEDKQDWVKIRTAFTKAQNEATDGDRNSVTCIQENLKRIKAGKNQNTRELVHLGNSMWWGNIAKNIEPHTVGITFYADYMVVCDRGMLGGSKDCTKIYKIDPSKVTEQQLKDIQRTPEDPSVILDTIAEIAGHAPPLATFPSKSQKFGTCNYANRLTSIEAMHCLVKLDRQGHLNDEAIKAYSKSNDRKEYKTFTTHNRDTEARRLNVKIMTAGDKPQLQAMYANLAIGIVKNRQKYLAREKDPVKKAAEIARNDKLMSTVSHVFANIEASLTDKNKQFFNQYLSTRSMLGVQEKENIKPSQITSETATYMPSKGAKQSRPGIDHVIQQPSTSLTQIKAYIEKEENKAFLNKLHISNYEVQPLGFNPQGRLKLEIQAPTDEKASSIYVDDNAHEGVKYSIDENATSEQRKQSIEAICKLAVENSTNESEFNLNDTPDDMKAEVKTALENAIKEKYPNPEVAPKLISTDKNATKLSA